MPAHRQSSRLPKRFPVGAKYVVEGRGGEDGKFRVSSRYVALPGGQRVNIPADFGRLLMQRPPPLNGVTFGIAWSKATRTGAKNSSFGGKLLRRADVDCWTPGEAPSPSPSFTRRRAPVALAARGSFLRPG
jgi:hypothetical protein